MGGDEPGLLFVNLNQSSVILGLMISLCLLSSLLIICAKKKKSCLESEKKAADEDAATYYDEIQISCSNPLPDEITEHSPPTAAPLRIITGGGSVRECNGGGSPGTLELTGINCDSTAAQNDGERCAHTIDRKLPEPPVGFQTQLCNEEQETALGCSPLPSNPTPDNNAAATTAPPGNKVHMRNPSNPVLESGVSTSLAVVVIDNRESTVSMDTYEKIGSFEHCSTPSDAPAENLYAGLEDTNENLYQRVGSAQSSASSDVTLPRKQPSCPAVPSGSNHADAAIYSKICKEDSGDVYRDDGDPRKMAAGVEDDSDAYDVADILDCYATSTSPSREEVLMRPRGASEPPRGSNRCKKQKHIYSEIEGRFSQVSDVYAFIQRNPDSIATATAPANQAAAEEVYEEAPPVPPRADDLDTDDASTVAEDDDAYLSIQDVEDTEGGPVATAPLSEERGGTVVVRDAGYGRVYPLDRPRSRGSQENIYEGVEEESYEIINNVYRAAAGGHDSSQLTSDPAATEHAPSSPGGAVKSDSAASNSGAATAITINNNNNNNRFSTVSDIYAQVSDTEFIAAPPLPTTVVTGTDPPQPPSLESLRTVSAAHRSPSPNRHSYSPVMTTNERRGSYHEAINEGLSMESLSSNTSVSERHLKGRSMHLDCIKSPHGKGSPSPGEQKTSPRHHDDQGGGSSPSKPLTPSGHPNPHSPGHRSPYPGPWVHIDAHTPPPGQFWNRRDHMYESLDNHHTPSDSPDDETEYETVAMGNSESAFHRFESLTRLDIDGIPVTYV